MRVRRDEDDVYLDDGPALEAIIQREIQFKKQLQFSTRGAGVAVVSTACSLKKLKTPVRPDAFPLYPLYRVVLALLEEKFSKICRDKMLGLKDLPNLREIKPDPTRLAALENLDRLPRIISGYIDHAGYFAKGSTDYVPVQLADRRTEAGGLVLDSGKVHISNLREIVTTLANARTNELSRRRFIRENPLPGAEYSEHGVILNPDDVMPAEYGEMGLRKDVQVVNEFFDSIEKGAGKWLCPPPNLTTGRGTSAVAVATDRVVSIRSTRSLADLANGGLVGVKTCFSYSEVVVARHDWIFGTAGFYREPPNHNRDRFPQWDCVARNCDAYQVRTNAMDCIRLAYGMDI